MKKTPFYADGLRFSCLRCSACCRYETGFVFLTASDIDALSRELQMTNDDFTAAYCRQVEAPDGLSRLSLREKSNCDCVFWKDDGCVVYKARPFQCRAFPFWPSLLASRAAWEAAALSCPGMGQGTLHTKEEIERLDWEAGVHTHTR